MKHIVVIFLALLSANLYAGCGYGNISSVRLDDASTTFRISFVSLLSSKNGCETDDISGTFDPEKSTSIDLKMAMSVSLTALTSGKPVWINYEAINNVIYIKKINIYASL